MRDLDQKIAKLRERKGARRRDEVPQEVLRGLSEGWLETVNLVEWLALDARKLLETTLGQVGIKPHRTETPALIQSLPELGVVKRDAAVGRHLADLLLSSKKGEAQFETLASHVSDTVRAWCAQVIAARADLNLKDRLTALRRFAADPHFGVRECAWMAFRPHLARELNDGLKWLEPWAKDKDANVRRFAIEVTRPRGVWCEHLTELKSNPERGLPLLEMTRADPVRYVQLSVANWLNDASKSHPEWVGEVCKRWRIEKTNEHTAWIIHHAERTLRKEKSQGTMRSRKKAPRRKT
ncbi:MAG: DNA alkylation repair protein [Planctomycetota bacterium]